MEMGACPACDAALIWRHNGLWCDRCHRKVETCCEGAPQHCVSPERGTTDPPIDDAAPVVPSSSIASAATGPEGTHQED